MQFLVSLLVAAALVSGHVNAQISNKLDMDNSLRPNDVPRPHKIQIRKLLKITPLPKTVSFIPGRELEVTCRVTGMPTPTVQWLKNGIPLPDYEEQTNHILPINPISIAHVNTTLLLDDVQDGDTITCVAVSGTRRQSSTTVVNAINIDPIELIALQKLTPPRGPKITLYYNSLLQNIGTTAVLPCRAVGDENMEIYWLDNHQMPIGESGKGRVLPTGELMLTNLRFSDVGTYTCVVYDKYGKDKATTFIYAFKNN